MARHERDFPRAGAPLSLDQLLALLEPGAGESGEAAAQGRENAIACYLSGAEGWNEAVKALGGAFASAGSGLRPDKED